MADSLLNDHLEQVIEPAWNFAGRIKSPEGNLQNALIGLAAESGELLDIGKKMWFHEPKEFEFYQAKALSELGDIGFYWLKAIKEFGFTPEEVLAYNRKKLESRHPELGVVTERFGEGAIRG